MPHYFVDGYNVIRSTEAFQAPALRDQREKLLRFIEDKKPQGANRVTVVFDGRADVSSPAWTGTTAVVFSPGKDADKVIKDRVDELANPRDAVVVTNDRSIQRWVRGVGARVMSCDQFLAAGRGPAARRRSALSAQDVEEINEELKKLWKLK
jgi:predicted RNA-binding protein with PIN domain